MRETRSQCATWIPEEGCDCPSLGEEDGMENRVVVVQKQHNVTQGTNGDAATT